MKALMMLGVLFSTNLLASEPFDMQYYVDLCGGTYYARCNEFGGVDQYHILNHAKEAAHLNGKHVIVVWGADWCEGCRDVGEDLKTSDLIHELEREGFVVAKINTDMGTAWDIAEHYQQPIQLIPHFSIVSTGDKDLLFDEEDSSREVNNSMEFLAFLTREATRHFETHDVAN